MTTARAALYSRLSSDSTLTALVTGTRIYDRTAPPDATMPYLIFQLQSGGPELICQRASRESIWVVKVVVKGYSVITAEAVLARVDTLLENHALSVTGYSTYYLKRVPPDIDYEERTAGGVIFRHFGHSYRHRMSAD